MHYDIERFSLTGTLNEGTIIETKSRLIRYVEEDMRENGFVPVWDLPVLFSPSYNFADDTMDFEISVYGISIGEQEACEIESMTIHGTQHQKYIVPAK